MPYKMIYLNTYVYAYAYALRWNLTHCYNELMLPSYVYTLHMVWTVCRLVL